MSNRQAVQISRPTLRYLGGRGGPRITGVTGLQFAERKTLVQS
jgi:hypothetical protein